MSRSVVDASGADASESYRGTSGRLAGLVIGFMAFLAALALRRVDPNRSAESWSRVAGVYGAIMPQASRAEKEVPPRSTLASDPASLAGTLSERTSRPVRAWLGRDAVISALPFPKLIDVRLSPGATPDIAGLERRLKTARPCRARDHRAGSVG